MADENLDSLWIRRLRAGDSEIATAIWNRYFEQLVRIAQKKLPASRRRAADEEDVVISAFKSFFLGVQREAFPKLDVEDDLWQVLLMLTARKAADRIRHDTRQKRGEGKIQGESAFGSPSDDDGQPTIGEILGDSPTPDLVVQLADELDWLLSQCGDERSQQILLKKLEGFTNEEIADQLDCHLSTVERKLRLFRKICQDESGHD